MIPEDVRYVALNCLRFALHRTEMEIVTGALLSPENIVDYMLASEIIWRTVKKFMEAMFNMMRNEEKGR